MGKCQIHADPVSNLNASWSFRQAPRRFPFLSISLRMFDQHSCRTQKVDRFFKHLSIKLCSISTLSSFSDFFNPHKTTCHNPLHNRISNMATQKEFGAKTTATQVLDAFGDSVHGKTSMLKVLDLSCSPRG